jgi:phage antirepressor YoqD-like protein
MEKLPLEKRYLLTIKETVALFGIGEKKLRQIVRANDELPFVLRNGTKYMIKRELFEEFIRETDAV